jgi:predicted NBD/HSP70 family sugar kinase
VARQQTARVLKGKPETLGASAIRAKHSRLILNLLWRERELSRAELARRTSLSPSTVSAIISDLLNTGLVNESRTGASSGGRRPIMLEFQDQSSFIVGIELGATHVSCVATDLRARIRASWSAPAPVRDDPETTLKKVSMAVRSVLEAADIEPSRVLGMGVAVPSPVNPDRPGEMLPLVVPKWEGYNIATYLEETFGSPVFVDNDANLGALAELWWGAGCEAADLTFIKVATGIGAGLIIDGHIFRGSGGIAGEIGHTSIDVSGPPCVCGLNGCLTTFIGTPAVLERARTILRDAGINQPVPTSIDQVVDAALGGEAWAVELVHYVGGKLGIGIANMLNLLNPKAVVIGGGISRAESLLIDAVQDTLRDLSLSASISDTHIRTTSLHEWGIALGAATLALEAALQNPSLFPAQAIGAAQ